MTLQEAELKTRNIHCIRTILAGRAIQRHRAINERQNMVLTLDDGEPQGSMKDVQRTGEREFALDSEDPLGGLANREVADALQAKFGEGNDVLSGHGVLKKDEAKARLL